MPLGEIANGDISSLVSDSGRNTQELAAAIDRECLQKIGGDYVLEVAAVWNDEMIEQDGSNYTLQGQSVPETVRTSLPVIHLTYADGQWELKLFEKTWKGNLGELLQTRLECPLTDVPEEIRKMNKFDQNDRAKFWVDITPQGMESGIEDFSRFIGGEIRTATADAYTELPPTPRGFYELTEISRSTTGVTRQGGVDSNSVVRTKIYHKPGGAGFSKLTCTMIPVPATP